MHYDVATAPNGVEGFLQLAATLAMAELGQIAEARTYIARGLELDPDNARALELNSELRAAHS